MSKSPNECRILVVDDEVYMREVVAFDLENVGYQVVHAEGGRDAFEIVKSTPLDVIVSDVRMPKGSGPELLTWVKERDTASPSFLFMTAFSDISADEAMDAGAEAFLTKPLRRDEMMKEVRKALIPRDQRWSHPVEVHDVPEIKMDGSTLTQLGSGGAFLGMTNAFPESLEILTMQIVIPSADQKTLTGTGRVRWVRHEPTDNKSAGIGLEFLYLDEDSRRVYLDYLDANRPKAFIPLGDLGD